MNRLAPTVPANSAGLPKLAPALRPFSPPELALLLVAGALPSQQTIPPPSKACLNFYRPSGPLSGVTTTAVLVWLTRMGNSRLALAQPQPLLWGASTLGARFCSA